MILILNLRSFNQTHSHTYCYVFIQLNNIESYNKFQIKMKLWPFTLSFYILSVTLLCLPKIILFTSNVSNTTQILILIQ